MRRKELSPYPPDRWIRQMNRKYPNLWIDLRKAYADPARALRISAEGLLMLKAVPEWCVMPTVFPFFLLMKSVLIRYLWRSDTRNYCRYSLFLVFIFSLVKQKARHRLLVSRHPPGLQGLQNRHDMYTS